MVGAVASGLNLNDGRSATSSPLNCRREQLCRFFARKHVHGVHPARLEPEESLLGPQDALRHPISRLALDGLLRELRLLIFPQYSLVGCSPP